MLSELATGFIENNLGQDKNLNYAAELDNILQRFPVLVFQVWRKQIATIDLKLVHFTI